MFELLVVLLLILCNSFFAMAEIAIVSSRRARLKQMAEAGSKGAARALSLADDPSSFLSTVQIGITVLSVLASVFSGATIARSMGLWLNQHIPAVAPNGEAWALAVIVFFISFVTLIIGELVPKRIAMVHAETIAVAVATPLQFIRRVMRPLVWLLGTLTELSLRLLGVRHAGGPSVTEEEVKTMIAEGTEEGVFEHAERRMIDSVMRLTDRTVRSIMTPRLDMVWIGTEDTPEEIRETIRASGYSRMPVAEGDLAKVHGVLHAKDMLNAVLTGAPLRILDMQRPVLSVPDTTPVLTLLDQFKSSGQHLAIVIDEYGTVEGLVSIADILIAIAGDLPEHGRDDGGDKPVQRADGSWLIDGMTPISDVEALTGLKNMQGDSDYHTLAGFMLAQLGRIPGTGEHFTWQEVRFEVLDMDGRRIDKVMITPAPAPPVTEA